MRFSLVVFALLLVSASNFAQAPDKPDVRAFTEFTGKGTEGQDYEFSVSGYKYTILSNGRGKREDDKGAVRRFNLRLSGVYLDGEIYYTDYRNDVLLICETSDSE